MHLRLSHKLVSANADRMTRKQKHVLKQCENGALCGNNDTRRGTKNQTQCRLAEGPSLLQIHFISVMKIKLLVWCLTVPELGSRKSQKRSSRSWRLLIKTRPVYRRTWICTLVRKVEGSRLVQVEFNKHRQRNPKTNWCMNNNAAGGSGTIKVQT